ncbi:hypothetical protein Ct61P_06402 [Colletotrichum tofieldiae]|nr:hypothetical protein Ct61P_06402 [Colletotrichum tofieldiae]
MWEFPSTDHFAELEATNLSVSHRWVEYMDTIARSANTGNDRVSPSLWQMARNDHLDVKVVTNYLELLRHSTPSCQIQQPIVAGTGADAVFIDQEVKMTLLPMQDENSWFAAVAYPDCIHIYNSDKESSMAPRMQEWLSSTFPNRQIRYCGLIGPSKQEDSGLLMLLTIRMLMDGRAPARRNDTGFVRNLRAKTFVELLTKNLDASDRDVDRLQQAVDEDNSVYFNDAFDSDNFSSHGSDLSFTADTGTMAHMLPTSVRSADDQPISSDWCLTSGESPTGSDSYSERSPSQVVSSRYKANGQSSATETTVLNSLGTERHPKKHATMPPSMPQECKTILQLLSEAVAFHRSSRLTISSDFATLWSSIRNGSRSEFYRRYNGVVFYEKMLGLRNDQEIAMLLKSSINEGDLKEMRSLRSRFKVWYDICPLRESWDQSKYTLLCVVSEKSALERASSQQQKDYLSRLQSRLEDKNDPFLGYIESAKELCCSLIEDRFPRDWLMIDSYHLKAGWPMLEPEFTAYTSLDPNPKIEMVQMVA